MASRHEVFFHKQRSKSNRIWSLKHGNLGIDKLSLMKWFGDREELSLQFCYKIEFEVWSIALIWYERYEGKGTKCYLQDMNNLDEMNWNDVSFYLLYDVL